MSWLKAWLRIKSPKEVEKEVRLEPPVDKALRGLRRVDRILLELEMLEGKRG